jgi:hypothetical protein
MRHKFIRSLLAAGVLAGAGSAVAVGATTAGAATASLKGSTWDITYTWPGYTPGTSTWTFSGHTVTTPSWTGPIRYKVKMVGAKMKIKVTYETDATLGYVCHAVYTGKIKGTHMSGTMATDQNATFCILGTGTWSATRAVAGPNTFSVHGVSPSGRS